MLNTWHELKNALLQCLLIVQLILDTHQEAHLVGSPVLGSPGSA